MKLVELREQTSEKLKEIEKVLRWDLVRVRAIRKPSSAPKQGDLVGMDLKSRRKALARVKTILNERRLAEEKRLINLPQK